MIISLYTFWMAFAICLLFTPQVISVARARWLYDVPNVRSSHTRLVPVLGGLAITASAALAFFTWLPKGNFYLFQFIFVGSSFLILIGLKDDLAPLPALNKLLAQAFATLVIVIPGKVQISSLSGLFGMNEPLPDWMGVLLSFIFILVLINAMNFMDGIDGLVGSLGVVTLLTLGIWMYRQDDIFSLLALSSAGALLGFLRYNLAPAKIFMGDTGSLFIGVNSAVLVIHFLNTNAALPAGDFNKIEAAPAVLFGLLAVPLLDFVRVCLVRMWRGLSPMRADRRHVHHMLIDLGYTHQRATLLLVAVQLGSLLLVYFLHEVVELHLLLLLMLSLFAGGYFALYRAFSKRQSEISAKIQPSSAAVFTRRIRMAEVQEEA